MVYLQIALQSMPAVPSQALEPIADSGVDSKEDELIDLPDVPSGDISKQAARKTKGLHLSIFILQFQPRTS